MANSNGWGDGASNNNIGWGKGADNAIGWGAIHADSWAGLTDIVGTPAVDPDAQAFITAASITDPTQQTAINNLVTGLKTDGIWTKMKALYPFVGGTASAHKFNLKDPRDLNAAFRLAFLGGWTHSSTGATPNGTNGYADTFLIPSTNQTLNSNGLGAYIGTLNTSGVVDPVFLGSFMTITQASLLAAPTNSIFQGRLNGNTVASSSTTPLGLLSLHRTSSTLTTIYRNSTNLGSGNSGGTLPTSSMFLGTIRDPSNNPYSSGYVNTQFRFAYFSDGLNSTEISNLYTRVQAFNTTLNRQV